MSIDTAGSAIVIAAGVLLGGCVERVDTASFAPNLRALASADLDGDGLDDLVVASGAPMARVTVLLSEGGGATTELPGPLLVGTTPRDVLLSDFDGDGVLDLAVSYVFADGIGPTGLYLGVGDGTFAPAVDLNLPEAPRVLAAGDLDGDGRVDLVVGGFDEAYLEPPRRVFVYLSDAAAPPGAVAFHAPVPYPPEALPRDLALGDLDGDGDIDLAVATATGIHVLLNDGAGAFTAAGEIPAGTDVTGLVIADFDRDGRLDLIRSDASANDAAIFFGLGSATFAAPVTRTVGAAPSDIAVADANRDGRPDIVTSNLGADSVTVLKGGHHRTPVFRRDFAVGNAPRELALGRFTDDPWIDAATLNDSNVTFLLVGPPGE